MQTKGIVGLLIVKFLGFQSPLHDDTNHYQRLIKNLIYLTMDPLDISFLVVPLSQFMH